MSYNRPYKARGKRHYPMASADGYRERGMASWYGSEAGSRTAMGVHYNPMGMTAAHKTLPLPTKLRVKNLRNNREIIVVVNDRGPFVGNRLIDLSRGAAKALGINSSAYVEIEAIPNAAVPLTAR